MIVISLLPDAHPSTRVTRKSIWQHRPNTMLRNRRQGSSLLPYAPFLI